MRYLLIFLMAFVATGQIPGTFRVTGPVAPPATNSNFGATDTIYGKGGHVTGLSSLSQAQEVLRYPLARRQLGMHFSLTDGTTYQLQTSLTNFVNVTPIYTNAGVGYNITLLGTTAMETVNGDQFTSQAFIADYDGVAAPGNYLMPKTWVETRSTAIESYLTNVLALPTLATVSSNGVPRNAIVLAGEWPGSWVYCPLDLNDTNGANIRYPDDITTNSTPGRWEFVSSLKTAKTVETISELLSTDPRELATEYVGTNTTFSSVAYVPEHGIFSWSPTEDQTGLEEVYQSDVTGYWHLYGWTDPVQQKPYLKSDSVLYGFGDSQTYGSQLAPDEAAYAPAGRYDEQYRWINIFASRQGRAMSVTNLAVPGSRFSWTPGATASLRTSPLNLMGGIATDWSGISTLMIGYNNLLYMPYVDRETSDDWAEDGVFASAARLLINDYASVGLYPDGSAFPSWATSGSTISWAYTDSSPFPTGAINREATELTGSEYLNLTIPEGASHVIVFAETTPYTGGVLTVWTNGAPAGTLTNLGYVNSASTGDRYPIALNIVNQSLDSFDLAITNSSGTNCVLGIGWITNATRKQILIGGGIDARDNASTLGSSVCALWSSASASAAARLSDLPIYFADTFGGFRPEFIPTGDVNHPNRPGNEFIAQAFENAQRLNNVGGPDVSLMRKSIKKSWESGLAQLIPVGRGSGNPTNAAAYFRAISGGSSTKGFQWYTEDDPRWELISFGSEVSTNANQGSGIHLRGYDDSGTPTTYLQAYRDGSYAALTGPWAYQGYSSIIGTITNYGFMALNGPNDQAKDFFFRNMNTNRWRMTVTGVETGVGNDGSNFLLQRMANTGISAGNSLVINRANGNWYIENSLNLGSTTTTGSLTIDGTSAGTKYLRFSSNSVAAFQMSVDSNKNLTVARYTWGGTNAGFPIIITGTNGAVQVGENSLSFTAIRYGTNILVAGTKAVTDPYINSDTIIMVTPTGGGGSEGWLKEDVASRVASTSFTVTSSNGADTQGFRWMMINP